jgi:hypothetical protein
VIPEDYLGGPHSLLATARENRVSASRAGQLSIVDVRSRTARCDSGRRPSAGIVNLGGRESFGLVMVGCRGVTSGRCHFPPDLEGSRSQESVVHRSKQVAPYAEKILDETVEREKPLGLASRFESAHVPLPLAGRLMRDFGAIVGVTFRLVSHFGQDRSQGGRVAS